MPVIVERARAALVPAPRCGYRCDSRPRSRENRSQLVFTTARGRDVVFWQSPRTRKQARPNVRTPTARAAGHRRAADPGRLPRAVRLPVQYPAGEHRSARAAVRRLRPPRRRATRRERGTQIPCRSGLQPDQRQAALSGRAIWPHYRARPLSSRTATRKCSNSTASAPPWSPTGWPNCRSAGQTCRSCSARPANSPRNGPTGSSPPPTPGRSPNTMRCNVSHQRARRHRPRPGSRSTRTQHRRSPRLGPGRRPAGTRPRPAPPRHLAGMARRQRRELTSTAAPRSYAAPRSARTGAARPSA